MKTIRFTALLICTIPLVIFTANAFAAEYYINEKTGSESNNGSKESPWKTPEDISWFDLEPGDTVYFARGCTWKGGFSINSSGTERAPILFSAYGEGEAPILTNPDNQEFNGNCIRVRGDHVTIEKLHFHETADARGERGKVDIHDIGAVFIRRGADYATIQDCEFTDCPKAINVFGEHSKITRNNLINAGRSLTDRWWGPIAICIQSNYHEISYNTIKDYIGKSESYNWDGSAIEIDIHTESADGLRIHHNTSIGNCGFIENEFWELGGQAEDWIIAYNVINDYQWLIDFGPGGDSIVANNTIAIRQKNPPCPAHVFNYNASLRGMLVNNIFISYGGISLDGVTAEHRKHNIFFSMDGKTDNPGGKEMGAGDREIDPMFVDVAKNDFRLLPGSPAIDKGINLGLTHEIFRSDRDGNPVPKGGTRDIGAFEFTANRKK